MTSSQVTCLEKLFLTKIV